MRRTLLGLLTALAVATGTTLVATPAEAAPKPVKIKKIPTRSVDWNGKSVVKPRVTKNKKVKNVKVTKKTLTVRQGGKALHQKRKSVKLPVGTYRVTTQVVAKVDGKRRVQKRHQKLLVKQGRCATVQDFRTLTTDPTYSPDVVGDSVSTVSTKLRSAGTGTTYTIAELRTEIDAIVLLLELLVPEGTPEHAEMMEDINELKAMLDDLQTKGVTTLEDREYRGCGAKKSVYASFAEGELMFAESDESGISLGLSATSAAVPSPLRAWLS